MRARGLPYALCLSGDYNSTRCRYRYLKVDPPAAAAQRYDEDAMFTSRYPP